MSKKTTFIEGVNFKADNQEDFDILRQLLSGEDDKLYKSYNGKTVRFVKEDSRRFHNLLIRDKQIYNQKKNVPVKKKIEEFVRNLNYIVNKEIKNVVYTTLEDTVVMTKKETEEYDDGLNIDVEVDVGPPKTKITATNTKPKVSIKQVYKNFLKNDPDSYDKLIERISINKGDRGAGEVDELRTYINKNMFGFDSSNPMYIKKYNADGRTDAFKEHISVIGYVKQLDKTVPVKDRETGGIKYNEYLKKNDPEGIEFAKQTKIMDFLNPDYTIKDNLKQHDYLKLKKIINRRLQLIGKPKIITSSQSKEAINDALKDIDIEGLINLYKSLPHLKRPDVLIEKEREIEKLKIEMKEGTTRRGIEARLNDQTAEEIISSEFNKKIDQIIVDDFIKIEGGSLKFYVNKIKEPESVGEASNAVVEIISNVVMKNKIEEAINKLSKQKSFRENTPGGRHDLISDSIGKITVTPTEMNKAIKDLDELGFIEGLQKSIYGLDYKPKLDIHELNKNVLAINYLSNKQFLKVRQMIDEYNNVVQPDLSEAFNKRVAETIEAPADVRVLPPGVRVQPVPEEEMRTDFTRMDEITKKIKQIQIDKIGLAGEALNQINSEEKLLRNQLNELTEKNKDQLQKKAKRMGQAQQASKRVGSVRPHFKNPTETAVQNAIGETPEQQIKDFNNWFVFDIPSDQTGQGTSLTNPLVKQNEMRQKLLGDGNVFNNFNQTYELTDGIEERKNFYNQHSELTKESVNRGLKTSKIKSEEEQFLASFNKDSNGLFTQDQSTKEINKWMPIYQTPNNFFGGTMYPFQNTANDTLLVSNFENNLNYFIEP